MAKPSESQNSPAPGSGPNGSAPSGKPGSGGPGNGNGPGGGPGATGQQGKNTAMMGRPNLMWLIVAVLLIGALFLMSQNTRSKAISWQEFKQRLDNQEFVEDSIQVKDDRVYGELKADAVGGNGDATHGVHVTFGADTRQYYVMQLDNRNANAQEAPGNNFLLMAFINFGPILLIVFLIYFFFVRSMRASGGGPGMLGSFGRSRHKMLTKEHSDITLDAVAGIDEAKDEVKEIIEFLKNPKKFQRLGGRVPRGVLLNGQPGCGKTLLAKAVAGEADVPFFSISGSDFVEMFVGVGASRVRDLFKQAKESSPCIIFLDEIDAVGRKRGNGNFSGGHDEREQTLNAILVEMDGFDSSDQVIVMAATNRSDVLDPALTRPGRFDRSIDVPLPDVVGRMEILQVHAKKIKLAESVDLEHVARGTPMFSGAELAALINEAAIGATLGGKDFVELEDLEEARDKIRFGRARKSRKVEEEERVATAYHEAGHAILQYLLDDADPLHKVTIIPRGGYMGASFQLPKKDRYGYSKRYLLAQMRVACGGRIAEEKKTNDVTSGASQDIRQVSQFARMMILEWGMSETLGFIDYVTPEYTETMAPERPYSEETARVIDDEVKRLSREAYDEATQILTDRWDDVVRIAEALLQHETLTHDDIDKLMKGESIGKPTISELLEAEKQKAAEDEKQETAKAEEKPDSSANQDDEDAPGLMPSPA